jgi:hypothetical protein
MNPKTPRPPTLAGQRAADPKGLAGTFDPEIKQEKGEPQDNAVPIAQARIVVGSQSVFLDIAECPLCGLQHVHGLVAHGQCSDLPAALARQGRVCAAHCHCQGPGRVARRVRGEWRTFARHAAGWREPRGYDYRLVLSEPACFTPRGIRSPAARRAMFALARKGVATSLTIWTPRRPCFRGWGDR